MTSIGPYRHPGIQEALEEPDALRPVIVDDEPVPASHSAAKPQSFDEWSRDARKFWLIALTLFCWMAAASIIASTLR